MTRLEQAQERMKELEVDISTQGLKYEILRHDNTASNNKLR